MQADLQNVDITPLFIKHFAIFLSMSAKVKHNASRFAECQQQTLRKFLYFLILKLANRFLLPN
jgi:hypothetical protein